MSQRSIPVGRLLAPASAALLALLGAMAAPARAEYGGLDRVGTFTPGGKGAHGEVNPNVPHAFGVDPGDGSFYIGDEFVESGKRFFRVQKFGAKGEFLAENRIPAAGALNMEGFALDSEKKRLYLLLVDERPGESEKTQQKIENDELKVEKDEEELRKKRERGEPTAELEEKIAALEAEIRKLEEELPVFDPNDPAAAAVYEFSTEVSAEKLASQTQLAGPVQLNPLYEEGDSGKLPLLFPQGIAVDPQTHDVLILGQQDESTNKGTAEEVLRAAVQRVHTEGTAKGKLGPRYLDKGNCLDEGVPSPEEEACKDGEGQPFSPMVSPGGKLYAERLGGPGEIWEIPATKNAAEAFESHPSEYAVQPRRLFALGRHEKLVEFTSSEEGGTMTFVPGASGGRIYLDAEVLEETESTQSLNRGALVLDYSEEGEAAHAGEIGWTAGQNASGENEKCVLPLGNPQVLVGADSQEHLLLFDATTEVQFPKRVPASVGVLQFGPGGEGCGHAKATPPSVAVGATQGVTSVPLGREATVSSQVLGANALNSEWKFKNLTTGKEEEPVSAGYGFQSPSVVHTFKEAGEYEITVIVEPDDFEPPSAKQFAQHSTVVVEQASLTVGFTYPGAALAGQAQTFNAKVSDPAEPTPHVKYVWEFGDGAEAEGSGGREFAAEHTYAAEGHYNVTLRVTDEGKRTGEATHTVTVSAGGGGGGGSSSGGSSEGSSSSGGSSEGSASGSSPASVGGSSGSGGVAGFVTVNDPEARLATSALSVKPSGVLTIRLTCPPGEASCAGTVVLRTASAVSAGAHKRKAILTLARGPFAVAGGQVKAFTLHLSAPARALLARVHRLRALAAIAAHDPAGITRTTRTAVTLRLLKATGGRKR